MLREVLRDVGFDAHPDPGRSIAVASIDEALGSSARRWLSHDVDHAVAELHCVGPDASWLSPERMPGGAVNRGDSSVIEADCERSTREVRDCGRSVRDCFREQRTART